MTLQLSNSAALRSAEQLLQGGGVEPARASLALLEQMELSLHASQKALLARDLAQLECHTGEQRRLQQALAILWQGTRTQPPSSPLETEDDRALGAQLRRAQTRVLHLARVQAALLARAQRTLHMISNLLAGTGAGYGPAASGLGTMPGPCREPEGDSACRA